MAFWQHINISKINSTWYETATTGCKQHGIESEEQLNDIKYFFSSSSSSVYGRRDVSLLFSCLEWSQHSAPVTCTYFHWLVGGRWIVKGWGIRLLKTWGDVLVMDRLYRFWSCNICLRWSGWPGWPPQILHVSNWEVPIPGDHVKGENTRRPVDPRQLALKPPGSCNISARLQE